MKLSIDGISVNIYPRDITGKHNNKYFKIVKNGTVFGKFRLDIMEWDGTPKLDMSTKKKFENYVMDNKEKLLMEISKL